MHGKDCSLARHHDMINSLKCLIGKKSHINIGILTELNQTRSDRVFHNLNENYVHRIRRNTKREQNTEYRQKAQ